MVRITICTTIEEKDKEFAEKNALKISELISWAINEKKQQLEGYAEPILREEQRKRIAFQGLCEKQRAWIKEKGLINELIEDFSKE